MPTTNKFLAVSAWTNDCHQVAPFNDLFGGQYEVAKPVDIDVTNTGGLLLYGGIDIHSSLYNEAPHPKNQSAKGSLSDRDVWEWELIHKCFVHNIPIIGICRGAQLLCAYDNGKLVQDLPKKLSGQINVETRETVFQNVSVDHHQAMIVRYDHKNCVLGWEPFTHTPQLVHFWAIKALGIQPHPEWMESDHPFNQYCAQIIKERLL